MNYQDLGEHAGALVTLIGVFAGVSGLLLWRMLVRLEKKIDEMSQHFCACREELPERFVPASNTKWSTRACGRPSITTSTTSGAG